MPFRRFFEKYFPLPSGDSSPKNTIICASIALMTAFFPLCQMETRDSLERTGKLETHIQSGDYESFLRTVSKSKWYKSDRNILLLNLDAGVAQVLSGDYTAGAKKLVRVGELSEDYYTKSVSLQVLSVLTNDNTLPYFGEDYEVTFASNIAAAAFAADGNFEDAIVESRKIEHRISVMTQAYEGSDKYSDDAFAHYLAGMLYEADGRFNDAYISYSHADRAYQSRFFPMKPSGLESAIAAAASKAGIDTAAPSDVNRNSDGNQADKDADNATEDDSQSQLLCVLALTGRGPVKNEVIVRAAFTEDKTAHVIKIAIPTLAKSESIIKGVRLSVDGVAQPMDLAADYTLIGSNAFKDREAMIYAKTLARVSARYLLLKKPKEKAVEDLKKKYEKAKEESGENSFQARSAQFQFRAASLALDILVNELLEHADTRFSLMIPDRVYSARLPVNSGTHSLKIEYLNERGTPVYMEESDIDTERETGHFKLYSALR